MKPFVKILLVVALCINCQAESGQFGWAHGFGAIHADSGVAIALDGHGSLYAVGSLSPDSEFDSGRGMLDLEPDASVYIAKFNALTGDLIWAKGLKGFVDPVALVADSKSDLIIAGWFYGEVDFDPGPALRSLTTRGWDDVFILKLSADGGWIWARRMGGLDDERPTSVCVDSEDNVYTVGFFNGVADFDPGVGVHNLTSSLYQSPFISKIDPNGFFEWARQTDGDFQANATSIAIHESEVYVGGHFLSRIDIAPGSTSNYLVSNGHDDAFLLKLDTAGNYHHGWSFGGPLNDRVNAITVGREGLLYCAGVFRGRCDFETNDEHRYLYSNGLDDIFIASFDSDANKLWAVSMGGVGSERANAIAVDSESNVYTTGSFGGIVDFDPSPASTLLQSAGWENVFVSKVDHAGRYVWSRRMGGKYREFGNSIQVDASQNVFLAGDYSSNDNDLDPTSAILELDAMGAADAFVTRQGADLEPPSVIDITPSVHGPVNRASVAFEVTFDEAVINFDEANDVVLIHNGSHHEQVRITGGPDSYAVYVSGTGGYGWFTLAVNPESDVVDTSGNALDGSLTSAPVYIDDSLPGLPINPALHLVALLCFGLQGVRRSRNTRCR